MLLKDCFIGKLVRYISHEEPLDSPEKVGVLIGITFNESNEVILEIQWADKTYSKLHPNRVTEVEE